MGKIYKNYRLLSFMLVGSLFAGEENLKQSIIKPGLGFVLLLNGTSSAGKSSVIKELQKKSNYVFDVVSMDTFPRLKDYGKEGANFSVDFYQHCHHLCKTGRKVIVDAVQFEANYEKNSEMLGEHCFKVLTYCPLDFVVEHVEKRNNSEFSYERRTVYQALNQFARLYTVRNLAEDVLIDRITHHSVHFALKKAQEESVVLESTKSIDDTTDYHQKYEKLVQKFEDQFNIKETSEDIALTQKYSWDLIVNSGTYSSSSVAQEIMNFLESKKS